MSFFVGLPSAAWEGALLSWGCNSASDAGSDWDGQGLGGSAGGGGNNPDLEAGTLGWKTLFRSREDALEWVFCGRGGGVGGSSPLFMASSMEVLE